MAEKTTQAADTTVVQAKFLLPKNVHEALRAAAAADGISMSKLVETLIRQDCAMD